MATRIIRTGRWVPDDVPTVYETVCGNGMTELTTVEPPKREIEYFSWKWEKPKKDDKWIYTSIAVASLAGMIAVLLLPIIPIISAVIILVCLAWLGFVAYANR